MDTAVEAAGADPPASSVNAAASKGTLAAGGTLNCIYLNICGLVSSVLETVLMAAEACADTMV